MIEEIDLSMVESMALFAYRVNGRLPGFHPEIFEVTRENGQLLLKPRYMDQSTVVPSERIVRILKALPKAEPTTAESNLNQIVGVIELR